MAAPAVSSDLSATGRARRWRSRSSLVVGRRGDRRRSSSCSSPASVWGPSGSARPRRSGSSCRGPSGIDTGATWTPAAETIVWELRLPRVLTAMVVGAGLAVAGATFQGLLRNPLADPFVLGTASGAALGAAIAILLPLGATVFAVGAAPGPGLRRCARWPRWSSSASGGRRAGRADPAAADRLRRRRRC